VLGGRDDVGLGALQTTMPRRVAAFTSTLSTPTPARPITRSLGALAISAASDAAWPSARRAHSASASASREIGAGLELHDLAGRRSSSRPESAIGSATTQIGLLIRAAPPAARRAGVERLPRPVAPRWPKRSTSAGRPARPPSMM
jgi:hypothetical protein